MINGEHTQFVLPLNESQSIYRIAISFKKIALSEFLELMFFQLKMFIVKYLKCKLGQLVFSHRQSTIPNAL